MTQKKQTAMPTIKRVFKGDVEIHCDTFKLMENYALVNIGFAKNQPIKDVVGHCHFYHTFDRAGRPMTKSNSVLGHYHDMTISVDSEGNLSGKSSTPKTNSGSAPLYPDDNHTHPVEYRKSEKFKTPKVNKEAVAVYNDFIRGFSKNA